MLSSGWEFFQKKYSGFLGAKSQHIGTNTMSYTSFIVCGVSCPYLHASLPGTSCECSGVIEITRRSVMKRIYRLLVPLSVCVVLTLLAGCGPYSTNSSASSTTPNTAVVKTATPVKKPIPTPRATPTPPPHSLRTGPVTLNVGASVYQPGDTIVFTLNNQGGQTIHFPNHLTDCSVVLLQHLVNGTWIPVAPCRLMILTAFLSLGSGQEFVVKLAAPRASGIYQGVLTYSVPGARRTIFSGEFQVV